MDTTFARSYAGLDSYLRGLRAGGSPDVAPLMGGDFLSRDGISFLPLILREDGHVTDPRPDPRAQPSGPAGDSRPARDAVGETTCFRWSKCSGMLLGSPNSMGFWCSPIRKTRRPATRLSLWV